MNKAEKTTARERSEAHQTVASTAFTAMGGQLAVYALSFLTSIVVTRSLEATGRGEYYVPVIAATACVALANIGLESATTVFVAKRERTLAELSRNATLVALIVGPISLIAMLLVFGTARSSAFRSIAPEDYLIAAATVPFSLHLLWLANVFLLAGQLARSQVALVAGAAICLSGAGLLSALGELGVKEALLLYGASVVVPWLLHLLWADRAAPVFPAFDPQLLKKVVAFGLKFHVGLVFSYLLLRFDVFLVNAYLGTAAVGVYSLAVLFAELVWLLTGPLVQATIPFQTRDTLETSATLAFKAARFNFALGVVISALFAGTLWFVLPLLYGDTFSDAYVPMLLLLPGVCAMAASRSLGLLIAREERPWRYGITTGAAFGANWGLNIWLLSELGIAGASVASSIAYVGLTACLVHWGLRVGRLPAREALLPQREDWVSVRSAFTRTLRRIHPRREPAET